MEIYALKLNAELPSGAWAAVVVVCAAAVGIAVAVIMHLLSKKKSGKRPVSGAETPTEEKTLKETPAEVKLAEEKSLKKEPAEVKLAEEKPLKKEPAEEKSAFSATGKAEEVSAETSGETLKATPLSAVKGQEEQTGPGSAAGDMLSSAADPETIAADSETTATDGGSGAEDSEDTPSTPFPLAARSFYYDRSFTARLIQSDGETKNFYRALKAEILSYGAKSRVSWKYETFRAGKQLLVKMVYRGKTLCLLYALPPAKYAETKYKVEDISEISRYAETPCLYRVTGERRAKYAAELAADVMAGAGLQKIKEAEEQPVPAYETTEELLKRNLIKIVEGKAGAGEFEEENGAEQEIRPMHSVRAYEVNVMRDEVAAAHVESSSRYADKTKTGIINVDTISANFEDGEKVTLEEIKKRVAGYNKVTYIKVLARGSLDKSLVVEADEFSIEAVKMILLTGGKAIRTKRRDE